MSHALIWTELDPNNISAEQTHEVPFAGFGTIVAGTWNKRLFKLNWINSSVEDVKLSLDDEYADIYTSSHFPQIAKNQNLKFLEDLGFEVRMTTLDGYVVNQLADANIATNVNISTGTLSGVNKLLAPQYVDGVKIDPASKILVKSQTSAIENGLYKVSVIDPASSNSLKFYNADEILYAGKIVSIGGSSWFSYLKNYAPFEFASYGSTDVTWVDRSTTYKLKDVQAASSSSLIYNGSGISLTTDSIDGYSLNLNDRVLIKSQNTKSQNGIYFVSSLYATDANTLVDPRNSTDSADNFWDLAVSYINNNVPVSLQILHGNTYGGKYYRYYSATANTTGSGTTANLSWTDSTHFYGSTSADFYYEISSSSGILFTTGTGNAGILRSTPNLISGNGGTNFSLIAGHTVLVKHNLNTAYSGVYTVVNPGDSGTASSGYWQRKTSFDTVAEFVPTVVKTTNNKSSVTGGEFFYLNRSNTYQSNYTLNVDGISITDRYQPYIYEPVTNLATSKITNFNSINISSFASGGIAISQRVLVTNQFPNYSENGIYIVQDSGLGSTFGLSYNSGFSISRGALATSAGIAATFFLYASGNSTAVGSTDIKWVNITNAPTVKITATTTVDKFTSGTYINELDFDTTVGTGATVLVNTTNNKINGIYSATLGNATKAQFDYNSGLQNFVLNIYKNILTTSNVNYTVSPNLREQIKAKYIASSIASTEYGNVYVPEINFPATSNYSDYFTNGNGSALLQDLEMDWYDQNFQTYTVRGVYYASSTAGLPISAGTAISTGIYNGSTYIQIKPGEDVLFYIGSGNASTHSYNGIYRARKVSTGTSVYFEKHEDFNFTTKFESNTNLKSHASPYERPTKVVVDHGYFIAGSSFSFDRVYMQGALGYNVRTSALGSSAIAPDDNNQYHAGSEIYVKDSQIFLTRDYDNLHNFANLAPIQHFLSGLMSTYDKINKDMLVVNRGQQLYSLRSGSLVRYYYELGDRVIYQDPLEDTYNSNVRSSTNGIYQIVNIDASSWTYYLRKVKHMATNGHLDHAKRLKLHSNNILTDVSLSLVAYEGLGSTYTFSTDNYPTGNSAEPNMDVIVYNSITGAATTYHIDDDFIYSSLTGILTPLSSLGSSNDELVVYLYSSHLIPRYNQINKSLYNRNYNVNQVLKDKSQFNTTSVKSGTGWTAEKSYFLIHNSVGNATSTDTLYNRDRKNWFNEFDSSLKYHTYINHIAGVGQTIDYFFARRLSSDGYYLSAGNASSSTFVDTGLVEPGTGLSTGLFVGPIYLEKNKYSSSGYASTTWFTDYALSATNNVLVLSNTSAILSTTDRSSYFNNKNISTTKTSAGKSDTKIYTFASTGYSSVNLTYHSSFANPLPTIKASAGINTYFLYFDPDATDRATDSRSWLNIADSAIYSCNTSTTANISDLTNLGSNSLNGYSLSNGNLILVNNQTDKKQNGIYSVVSNAIYKLTRAEDFNSSSHIRNLGRVSYGNQIFELLLPSGSYTLGSTDLIWNLVGTGYTIDVMAVTSTNYSSGTAATNFPDTIDSYLLSNNDKVFLLGQSSNVEKYVGRLKKNLQPQLSRVAEGGSGNTAQFSITNCFATDTNRNKSYELYFDPSQTTLGTHDISWFERNYINNYVSASTASTTNYDITLTPDWTTVIPGSRVLLKNQSNAKENGIYVIDNEKSYFLTRNEDLDEDYEFSSNRKVYVLSGNNNSGYYGLSYDENLTPAIDVTSLFWNKVNEVQYLNNCNCATTASNTDIDLSNPPTSIDGVTLEKNYRILVKNQDSNKEQNGIYVLTDTKNKIWQRSSDLDSSEKLVPQLSTQITSGSSNGSKIYRIVLPVPNTITNIQATSYTLETTDIEWNEVSASGLFNSSPETWQKIGTGTSNTFNLGSYSMDSSTISSSKRIGIAIKVPSASTLSNNLITENGKVRNIRFKVEYKTKED
jgi:hypothetical protein